MSGDEYVLCAQSTMPGSVPFSLLKECGIILEGAISPKFWPQFGNFSQFLVASRTMFASIIMCTQ